MIWREIPAGDTYESIGRENNRELEEKVRYRTHGTDRFDSPRTFQDTVPTGSTCPSYTQTEDWQSKTRVYRCP